MPEIYEVITIGAGLLYAAPKPNSAQLKENMDFFNQHEIHVIVSHLEKNEASELGLDEESVYANKAGIEFVAYPIKDGGLPDSKRYKAFIEMLYLKLQSGLNMVIHCKAGIGRTGVTAACLLIHDGFNAHTAMDIVTAARGIQIPQTQEQYDFICGY